jgi:hypothetical protein
VDWISFSADGGSPPEGVRELGHLLARHVPALRATESPAGGSGGWTCTRFSPGP